MTKTPVRAVEEPRAQKHTPKGEQRRQAILGSAALLFDRDGYHNTTMAAVAEHSDTTKANIYHYFKAKHDILFAIQEAWMDDLFTLLERHKCLSDRPEVLIRQVIRDILLVIDSRQDHVRVYFEYIRELPPELHARAREKRDDYAQQVTALVERAIDEGTFARQPAQVATLALFGLANWAYQWYRPGGALSHEEIADQLAEIYLRGVTAADSGPGRRH